PKHGGLPACEQLNHCGVYLLGSLGASESTIFSKRGSPRSGSQKCSDFNRGEESRDAHWSAGTLNSILASWSGALPSLRRRGSQRGSEWILSKRFSVTISASPPSWYVTALSSHSNALSASPQKA